MHHRLRFLAGAWLCVALLGEMPPLWQKATAQAQISGAYNNPGYGSGYGYSNRRSGSGYGNSYGSGLANVIRAQGQYQLLQSQAMLTNEQVRSAYLDNKQKWTQNYFQMREQHQTYVQQIHDKNKHSAETLTGAAKSEVPQPLATNALDQVTGRITWPESLRGSEYAALRTRLDDLFAVRAKTNGGTANAQKIHAAAQEFSAKLRENIEAIPVRNYVAARKFLDRLDFTAQTPAG